MKSVTVKNYKKDKYYPRVVQAVARLLERTDVIAPVEILMEMGNLRPEDHEDWRRGRVAYMERVFRGNLSKAYRILRIIGFHVHDLNMVPRHTVYHQWGKGSKRVLQFSKSGDPNVEKAYSTHYVWNRSEEKKREVIERGKNITR